MTAARRPRPVSIPALITWVCALLTAGALLLAQERPASELVGSVEGEDVVVRSRTPGVQEVASGAQVLVSGDEVTVRSRHARLRLADGGAVEACGPANFTVLRSQGALTVALNFGRLRARLDGERPLAVFTPFVVATPISIGGDPREVVVGLEVSGAMCVNAGRGAVRLENQFSGEKLVVPQAGEFFLQDGSLLPARAVGRNCSCEIPIPQQKLTLASDISAQSEPDPAPARVATPLVGGRDSQPGGRPPETAQPFVPAPEPTWTVVMPPLSFDASKPEPEMAREQEFALLIRQVRVQPAVIFRGEVVDVPPEKAKLGKRDSGAGKQKVESSRGFFRKVGRFFKRLFGG